MDKTIKYIREKINFEPEIGIVLGSGLGDFADSIENKVEIAYKDIPDFPVSTVKGHDGKLIFGKINSKKVCLMKGRIHFYEGYEMAKTYGSMHNSAMMECINIIHQGGAAALKRILAKTAKPYTSERIYAALCTDPADKSNNNQVGDYTTRQKKVIEMIRTYAVEEGTKVNLWDKTKKLLDDQVGYLEKRSNANLDSKTGNAGYGNYTKYSRDVNNWGLMGCQGQPWCATYQFWICTKIFGKAKALEIMGNGF